MTLYSKEAVTRTIEYCNEGRKASYLQKFESEQNADVEDFKRFEETGDIQNRPGQGQEPLNL